MKKYKLVMIAAAFVGFTSCGDSFLTSTPTEKQEAGAPATEGAIFSNLVAAYQVLLFDSYADNNYNSILLTSDLRSDDIYKGGGDAGDQRTLYLLSQFTSTANETLSGLWAICYGGVARCNNAIIACNNAVDVNPARLERYEAEAHMLRAYYMHILWKYWGNVPYFEEPLINPPYVAKQYKADEIYAIIMRDLDFALADDRLPMSVDKSELGRVTRAAALMLKARVVMYQKDEARYVEITKGMAEIIKSKEYELMPDFSAIWLDENEFCKESIFESNQLPEGKTWDKSWQGYGTNLPAIIAPNELKVADDAPLGTPKGGWGFGPVRQAAYNIYETGDTRREGSINSFDKSQYSSRFQNTGLFQAKYAARKGYNPPPGDTDLNYCNNLRIYRFAETLLNYVEMVKMYGQAEVGEVSAQDCFDLIRSRAFGRDNSVPVTVDGIKLERRREFLGEGMRFWDLVRWGDTTVLTENDSENSSNRTWTPNKKYLPIPQREIDSAYGTEFPLIQNPD